MCKNITTFIVVILLSIVVLTGCGNASKPANSISNVNTAKTSSAAPIVQNPVKSTQADIIYGRVVHISDGDTLTIQPQSGNKFKVRMYGIDAPEKAQPYGPQSTGILRQLIGNQYVNVKVYGTDRYGRKLAKIYLNKQDINAEMVKLGAAWHYRYYDKSADYDRYEQLEKNARANHKGLWNRNNPTAPWDYRKANREQKNKK